MRICEVANCNNKHNAHGFCKKHYDAEHHKLNRDKKIRVALEWYQLHKTEKAAYDAVYRVNRAKSDPNYRLARALRKRINMAVRNGQKAGSAVRDLGCSIGTFRLYIENQFEPNMSWDNYGEWHLDHVLPLSSFDLTDRSQFLEAANWLNYQPLWAMDNQRKLNKLPWAVLAQME